MRKVGTKAYYKEMYAFFKKNGGKGCEYNGWWYFQGYARIDEEAEPKAYRKKT